MKLRIISYFRDFTDIYDVLQQRFSNFFDYGPLFSSGIVGGPPHLLQ